MNDHLLERSVDQVSLEDPSNINEPDAGSANVTVIPRFEYSSHVEPESEETFKDIWFGEPVIVRVTVPAESLSLVIVKNEESCFPGSLTSHPVGIPELPTVHVVLMPDAQVKVPEDLTFFTQSGVASVADMSVAKHLIEESDGQLLKMLL